MTSVGATLYSDPLLHSYSFQDSSQLHAASSESAAISADSPEIAPLCIQEINTQGVSIKIDLDPRITTYFHEEFPEICMDALEQSLATIARQLQQTTNNAIIFTYLQREEGEEEDMLTRTYIASKAAEIPDTISIKEIHCPINNDDEDIVKVMTLTDILSREKEVIKITCHISPIDENASAVRAKERLWRELKILKEINNLHPPCGIQEDFTQIIESNQKKAMHAGLFTITYGACYGLINPSYLPDLLTIIRARECRQQRECMVDESQEIDLSPHKFLEAYQLVLALAWLHSQGFVHGDINPRNILYKSYKPVIADFEGACHIDRISLKRSRQTKNYVSQQERQVFKRLILRLAESAKNKALYYEEEMQIKIGIAETLSRMDILGMAITIHMLMTYTHPFQLTDNGYCNLSKKRTVNRGKAQGSSRGMDLILNKMMHQDGRERHDMLRTLTSCHAFVTKNIPSNYCPGELSPEYVSYIYEQGKQLIQAS